MSSNSLPSELQLLIIREAIRADLASGSSSSSSSSPCRNFDTQQALDLAPVSSACRSIIAGLLYSTVRITKPSTLKKFAVTLKESPELAKLVQSLHLGLEDQLPCQGDPENQLRCQGWPVQLDDLVAEYPLVYVETTLGEQDKEKLPRWCRPGRNFSISVPFKTCAGYAVGRAIDTAIAAIDVELRRRGYAKRDRRIGLRAWAARLFMLQGCLDMYLMEMRRREDERGHDVVSRQRLEEMESTFSYPEVPSDCEHGRCGHYPPLQYRGPCWEGSDESASLQNHYIITSEELWKHIARPAGPVNHFDHVLLYTDSTQESLEISTDWQWKRVKARSYGPHHDLLTNLEWEDMYGVDKDAAARRSKRDEERRREWREDRAYERQLRAQAARSDDEDEERDDSEDEDDDEDDGEMDDYFYEQFLDDRSSASAESEEDDWEDQSLQHAVPSVAELIEAGRSILAATSSVTNLSLTGFFHRALTSLSCPDKLVSLNLGPLTEYWSHVLPHAERLVSLKKLRICGNISSEDAAGIASCMPRLERVQWELTEEGSATMSLLDVIRRLQGLGDEKEDKGSRKRRRDDASQDGEVRSASSSTAASPSTSVVAPSARSTEVWLHSGLVRSVLGLPPYNDKTRGAWARGELAPGALHRVKVMESSAVVMKTRFDNDRDKTVANEFEIGRRWWEEGVAGMGGGE